MDLKPLKQTTKRYPIKLWFMTIPYRLFVMKIMFVGWLLNLSVIDWVYRKLNRKKPIQCTGWEGPCDSLDATRYRMNTAYNDEESNWAILCPCCQKACKSYWDERWAEYYSSVL